jgi:hypothetical protein
VSIGSNRSTGRAADGAADERAAAGPPAEATLDPAVDLSADLDGLKEERDFLIRSLKDLDAEHEAGDIDEVDYRSLKDDYIARTAGVLRAIEASSAPPRRTSRPAAAGPTAASSSTSRTSAERSRRRWRLTAVSALIVAVGALAAWGVTASSGSRLPGQTVTGNQQATGTAQGGSTQGGTSQGTGTQSGVDQRIVQASQLVNKGDVAGALKLYDAVLKDDPTQPVALANEGWLIAQAGMAANPARPDLIDSGLSRIGAAEQIDSTYAAAHFFRGYVLFRGKNDARDAVTEFRLYLSAVDPSSPEVPEVEQLLQQAMAAAGLAAPPGLNAPGGQAGTPTGPPARSTAPRSP